MGRLVPAIVLMALAAFSGCARGPSAPEIALTSDAGAPWTLSSQHGKAVLLTFGFTHCADTCPAILARLARLSERLDSSGHAVEIAFVTVDPARDTPAALHRFLAKFETDRIVGLTGSPAQIDDVLKDYHVWAQRVPDGHGKKGYDVAHSAVIYFIDASGKTRSIHDDDDTDATISQAVRELLG